MGDGSLHHFSNRTETCYNGQSCQNCMIHFFNGQTDIYNIYTYPYIQNYVRNLLCGVVTWWQTCLASAQFERMVLKYSEFVELSITGRYPGRYPGSPDTRNDV